MSPKTADVQNVSLAPDVDLELVWCPPGRFIMGSPESEEGRRHSETQHEVTLTKGFWMGKYEVTQAQWKAVMGSNPSYFKDAETTAPVERVTWDDCQEFIRKLNAMIPGGGFRLPTEAEWEYACRAGTKTALHTGSSTLLDGHDGAELDAVAWYGGNSHNRTHPVGQKQPNAWGLYDMYGNVWEWCLDWYDWYPWGSATDPEGPGSGSYRASRGGCWCASAMDCRSSSRLGYVPGFSVAFLGLRLLRTLNPPCREEGVDRDYSIVEVQRKGNEETQIAQSDQAPSVAGDLVHGTTAAFSPTIGAPITKVPRNPGDVQNVSLAPGVDLELVWCPPGRFIMGSPTSEEGRSYSETQHKVKLTKGFWMGKYDVTQAQWEAVMGSNPSYFKDAEMTVPVERVTWDDCQEFIRKLNAMIPGGGFRLPTEAEWEYACRAGTKTALHTGSPTLLGGHNGTELDVIAWYGENSLNRTHPVGQKQANAWGLYDMYGNVCEWCSDWCGPYPTGGATDPSGSGSGFARVCRGGSWDSSASLCRSANRGAYIPGFGLDNLGFRLLRTLEDSCR